MDCLLAALGPAAATAGPADWSVPARESDWTCWEALEHLADCLLAYALQLGPQQPPLDDYVPLAWAHRRDGGPGTAIAVDPSSGPVGLLEAIAATGGVAVAIAGARGPQVRAKHSYGIADPEAFAAMGVVETLVHGYDVCAALGVELRPPAELCARTLARLFPEVPVGEDPWQALLWATGRIDLPALGEGRRTFTTWHSAPLHEGE
ncbi:hypothetical protein C7C46_16000 [Streptomyces tateyamensis]|uniref:Mycothiol-dependent maleylpyruvate isomerase metal-binding domain-containing protein n=1 Tax=Streptomyces tateyamensis TaxID=565073 RepID=A0A2V4NEF7_9ACTN|nr:hypothetical protein C7C46_16000 [Streptomyces tateyamensis]